MNKQRICIVGDGLSGLMTAAVISKMSGVHVSLVAKNTLKDRDKRTTAISESNFKFFKENILSFKSNLFWPSKNIELYYESSKEKINFLNLNEKKDNLMYVFENQKIKELLFKEIVKNKINIIRKEINDIKQLKNFELIILCLGGKSKIYNNLFKKRPIKKDYKEIAVTGHVKHKFKNLNTSQFFLKEGPLAILPYSRDCFSFVWSLKKSFYEKNLKKINNLVKIKILDILNAKENLILSNLQSYPIFLVLKRQYHEKNILVLGEGLHVIHPIAGQGFNLVIRDIKKLKEILKYYLDLGISINNSYALNDFYKNRKPENMIMGLGIDATHNFFKQNKFLDPIKKTILKQVSKSELLSNLSKRISDKGLY